MGLSRQEYWSGVPLPSPLTISSYSLNPNLNYILSKTTTFLMVFSWLILCKWKSKQSKATYKAMLSCITISQLIKFSDYIFSFSNIYCCCLVTKSCTTLTDPMDCSMPGFPVLYQVPEFAQTHVHWVGDAIQPAHPLSPLFLLPLFFPSIRAFSKESTLPSRWLKYWSFSFSISSSNEYSGLMSFRIEWFDLLAVQGLSRVFSTTTI